MGQDISQAPFDAVIYIAKFLWIDDIQALTTVSRTLHNMIESESDLWRTLLQSAIQRVVSVPSFSKLCHTSTMLTKVLLRRICDFPTCIDKIILRKHKGPRSVSVEEVVDHNGFVVSFNESDEIDNGEVNLTKRSVVSNNCFPCLMSTSTVPRALVPFTKIALSSGSRSHHLSFMHSSDLSSVAYFEATIHHSPSRRNQTLRDICDFYIGLACAPFVLNDRVPGEDSYSFGYCSANGNVMHSRVLCSTSNETYGVGDTVGCGLNYPLTTDTSGYVFFTKNGILQSKSRIIASNFYSIPWFPVLGAMTSRRCSVSLNFGVTSPFLFDVNGYELESLREEFPARNCCSLSDFYIEYINSKHAEHRNLTTAYVSSTSYTKKDTFSLFSNNTLLHETMRIVSPNSYKNQGVAILSDSDEDY